VRRAVGVVLVAELCAQQGLFRPNACKERRDDECREDHAGTGSKAKARPIIKMIIPRCSGGRMIP
jgi:hypothetical protein